jgi:hypothetical protein
MAGTGPAMTSGGKALALLPSPLAKGAREHGIAGSRAAM